MEWGWYSPNAARLRRMRATYRSHQTPDLPKAGYSFGCSLSRLIIFRTTSASMLHLKMWRTVRARSGMSSQPDSPRRIQCGTMLDMGTFASAAFLFFPPHTARRRMDLVADSSLALYMMNSGSRRLRKLPLQF